jgi:hypothetical protein
MKGGFGCSPCCAPTDPCPECLYSAECGCVNLDFDEITGSLTVDGTTLSFFGAGKSVTPSAEVRSCFELTPNSSSFSVGFTFQRVVSTGQRVVNGCDGCFVRLSILFSVFDSGYSAQVSLVKAFDYQYLDCADDGGSTFVESEWQIRESEGFSVECMSTLIDFAETFPITGSVFFEPCYAAP